MWEFSRRWAKDDIYYEELETKKKKAEKQEEEEEEEEEEEISEYDHDGDDDNDVEDGEQYGNFLVSAPRRANARQVKPTVKALEAQANYGEEKEVKTPLVSQSKMTAARSSSRMRAKLPTASEKGAKAPSMQDIFDHPNLPDDDANDEKARIDDMLKPNTYVSDHPINKLLEMLQGLKTRGNRVTVIPLPVFQTVASSETWSRVSQQEDDNLVRIVQLAKRKSKFPPSGLCLFPSFVQAGHYVLVTADIDSGDVKIYDSLQGNGPTAEQMSRILFYLANISERTEWNDPTFEPTPQQAWKSWDCAICMLSFIRSLIVSNGESILSTVDGFSTLQSAERANRRTGRELRERFHREITQGFLEEWQ